MDVTERLALPFILPGQAQKELTHNEALQQLDLIVAGAIEEPPRNDPPQSPAIGSCFIVGSSPTGEWASLAAYVAGYTSGGWRYIPPADGMRFLVRSSGETAIRAGGVWELGKMRGTEVIIGGQKVVGSRGAAIAAPTAGAIVDVEARATISALLSALRAHGLIEA